METKGALLFALFLSTQPDVAIAACGPGESELTISITTDNYGSETSWTLKDECSDEQIGTNTGYSSDATFTENFCVSSNGRFSFTINDSFGDGMCCEYGNGSYEIKLDGNTAASGGSFESEETKMFGAVSCNSPPESTNTLVHIGECSSGSPCGECEGDCDSNGQCENGLICFKRDGIEQVPGCSGEGVSGKDYCVNPNSIETSSLLHLGDCSSSRKCGVCQGDCDGDSQCQTGLVCFQRDETEQVPGCSGEGISGKDYCANPAFTLTDVGDNGSPSSAFPLQECQGDCDGASQCDGDLFCCQRSSSAIPIPGCFGAGSGSDDYCCNPGPKMLVRLASNINSLYPLKECQADCDNDDECEGNLKCFQRSAGDDEVPGCFGVPEGNWDYCYNDNPNSTPSTPLPTTTEPTKSPTKQPTSQPTPEPTKQPTVEPTQQPTAPTEQSFVLTYNRECSSTNTCALCEGDCDITSHCEGNSVCCHRGTGSFSTIPGCEGTGLSGKDYCCNPIPGMLVRLGNDGSPSDMFPLKECQGDCDSDADCEGSLKCFKRSDFTAVPGCSGTGEEGLDYCYDDSSNPPPPTPLPQPTTPQPVQGPVSTPPPQPLPNRIPLSRSTSFPLGLCQGDCDNDNECQSGLVCYQRDGTNVVPGCIGNGENNIDYCIPFLPNCGTNADAARMSGDNFDVASSAGMTIKNLTAPCTLYRKAIRLENGNIKYKWVCELDGIDISHQSGHMVDIEGLDIENVHETMTGVELISGQSTLSGNITLEKQGQHFKAVVNQDTTPHIDRRPPPNQNMGEEVDGMEEIGRRRKLIEGTKSLLAIRVVATDASVGSSTAFISDKVFGTNGDNVNLKSQFAACSYNKLTFNQAPNQGTKVVNGVAEVTIPINVNGKDISNIEDEVTYAATCHLGDLPSQFDHVMYCIPPGTVSVDDDGSVGGWIAYAYFGHWLSVYNDDWCNYPSVQLHEVGHNLNLEHAWEGSEEYGDTSGMMGYSYSEDETPVMCFNAAKSWQLGWYSDRHITVTPSSGGWSGVLIGVADYGTSSETVLVKMDTTSATDYYVNFNRASGINEGTREGGNQVLVTRQTGNEESYLVAKLNSGSSFTFPNVFDGSGQAVSIVVNSIDITSPVGTASITIGDGEGGPESTNTLTYIGNNGGSGFPLGMCEGDCDNASECQSGLVCCERDGFTPIPGCDGTGDENTDYCCGSPEGQLVHLAGVTSGLQECQGHCDVDSDCAGNLKCSQRVGTEAIPGCSGSGESSVNYCFSISVPPSQFSYVPGDLTVSQNGLKLSTGLSSRVIATKDQPVQYDTGGQSSINFHSKPDGAAVFNDEDTGGWIYVSNSESSSNGGVGAITFNSDGQVIDYKMLLTGTSRNCGGGKTFWNTWLTCEEHDEGQVHEVDPWGIKSPRETLVGGPGDDYESAAYDNRDVNNPKFFVTTDRRDGPVLRYTPDPQAVANALSTNPPDYSDLLHSRPTNSDKIEYLILSPINNGPTGTFTWSTSLADARNNAFNLYPSPEGIDVREGIMYVTAKRRQQLFIIDLDNNTYEEASTESGAFNNQPDQVARILGGPQDLLYFCEDGGEDCGVHARDSTSKYFTILETDGSDPSMSGETTGLAFSPDNKHMYVSFQDPGKIFDITRDDGFPFGGQRLDIKYHADGDEAFSDGRRLNA